MASLNSYNLAICLVVAIGGFTFGFGSSVFVTSTGQPGFYVYFELDPTSLHTANIVDTVFALFYVGAALGAISQSFLADLLGRKKALAIAAVLALVGCALVAGSVAITMLIVTRILQGCGLGMLLSLVPLYLTEVAPPRQRGFLTGLTTLSFGLGYTACSWISLGCYYATDLTLSWRLPLSLACIGPLGLLLGLLFIPESPRYLVWRGKHGEAWDIIRKLHHDTSDPAEEAARAELNQIVRQAEADKDENPTFLKMLKKPSWRRRSLLVMFLPFAAQCTGIYGITNYLPLIFGSLGMKGSMPLVLYATHTTIGTICVLVSILLVDRVGRRTLFLIGYSSLACILLAESLLQWKYLGTDDKSGNAACVLFIFLYIVFFQCVDAPAFVWVAEVFPTTLRAKGLSLAIFSLFVGTITFTAPSAVAFQKIGWHMFLIYFALSVIALIITYIYIPETKGLPVEEIGALFGDEVVVHLTSDGHAIVEDKQAAEEIENSAVVTVQKV